MLDGHKPHVSIGLVEWAKEKDIILFILPAHTSHILQPLDVAIYGPLQKIYNNLCHKFTRSSTGCIDRYDVCGISSKAYCKAFAPENLHSAFRRTGIFPFNNAVIRIEAVLPAEVFGNESSSEPVMETEIPDVPRDSNDMNSLPKTSAGNTTLNPTNAQVIEHNTRSLESPSQFMQSKLIDLKTVKSTKENQKKPRNTLSRVVSGKAITEPEIEIKIIEHQSKFVGPSKAKKMKPNDTDAVNQKSNSKGKVVTAKPVSKVKGKTLAKESNIGKGKGSASKQSTKGKLKQLCLSPVAGPSHINLCDDSDLSESNDDEIDESENAACVNFSHLLK